MMAQWVRCLLPSLIPQVQSFTKIERSLFAISQGIRFKPSRKVSAVGSRRYLMTSEVCALVQVMEALLMQRNFSHKRGEDGRLDKESDGHWLSRELKLAQDNFGFQSVMF